MIKREGSMIYDGKNKITWDRSPDGKVFIVYQYNKGKLVSVKPMGIAHLSLLINNIFGGFHVQIDGK